MTAGAVVWADPAKMRHEDTHGGPLLLMFILIWAIFGVPFAGYFDPFSILVRGLVQAIYPAINEVTVPFSPTPITICRMHSIDC